MNLLKGQDVQHIKIGIRPPSAVFCLFFSMEWKIVEGGICGQMKFLGLFGG
jgi:hypothetical protein